MLLRSIVGDRITYPRCPHQNWNRLPSNGLPSRSFLLSQYREVVMEFLKRKEIDTERWNDAVAASPLENIYCYAWYLDAAAPNWGALATPDYRTILPLPFTKKLGVPQMIQPVFTREIDLMGTEFNWSEALALCNDTFREVSFRNRSATVAPSCRERKYQWLSLRQPLRYSTNAKRLVKRAMANFTFRTASHPEKLMKLFTSTVVKKVKTISRNDVRRLEHLIGVAVQRQKAELIEARQHNETVAAACFLKDKRRITYLKGAATASAKKQGAMFGLIDCAIQKYSADYDVFDFGGSAIDSIAQFYKKFGATDQLYYEYTFGRLPLWLETVRSLKKYRRAYW